MADNTIKITLNGQELKTNSSATILEVINENNIAHPQLCYVPEVDPIRTCDTCIVEVDGKLMRSCSTLATNGMDIHLHSDRANAAQTEAMDRLLENHLLYCTVCDNNNGNCKLHNTAELMEIEHQKYPYRPKVDPTEVDMSHPFYRYDPNQCIACGQCVEVCQNLQVNETLSLDWEAERPRVIWDDGVAINDSSCVSCGQCVTVCPCNALMEKSMLGEAGFMSGINKDLLNPMVDLIKEVEPGYSGIFAISEAEAAMRETRTKKTKTVCTFCGVGCSFEVWTKGRKILKVQPTSEGPVNGISTCVKGKFGWDFVNSDQRLTSPLIRQGDEFVEATWEEALSLMASKMGAIKETYGGEALGFISSSKFTNEENYLMQKLARQVFQTNNVDNCSRYCQSPASWGLQYTGGIGGDSGTIKDIASAGLVILVGCAPGEGHPVLATRIKRAHKLHGQKLISVDLRKHEMAERADLFMRPKQGTDYVWLSAVAKYIIEQNWHDAKFIEKHVNFYPEYLKLLENFTLEFAEQETGISQETLIQVATMIHEADGTAICWGMGVTQNIAGSYTSIAIANLLLVTGNFMRPGAGAYPLRGHNNVQGAADMGTMPDIFPGYQPVTNDAIRSKFEAAYGVQIPSQRGLDNIQMLEAIETGKLKGMYIAGEEMAWVDADSNHTQEMLANLDFLVVQDVFLSKTAEFADVILPAVPSLEKDGTFTNTERRVQRLYEALRPVGDSKPDWWIFSQFAKHMGFDWDYSHPSEIFEEMAALTPFFSQCNYDVLEGWNSFHWGSPDGSNTPLLHTNGFNFPDKKARLGLFEYVPPKEYPAEFDLTLNNGRLLEQFHEGNMTTKSTGLQLKLPKVFVEVSPELAEERGVTDGSLVRLESPYGAVKLHVLVTDRVQGTEIYVPMHSTSHEGAVNLLTGGAFDVVTRTPAYKQTKVRMQVLEFDGQNPLPHINPRYKKRHPQNGVEVNRKWNRPGYIDLVDQK
ncbi:formate dehydrogenase subunit alpha [Paenibacillus polymyxa]|uniref:formate dehydrogenase subunit alpha n=1 Tax=Paenibacillus polymyxa TaxID=1406 RepID=UPI000D97749A|nr:formate dehydrogenase subunit alpha [Paenibacillus polymyxa]KAE8559497.1 formate dehydrogenase subunit alpha [Paenibacillus polymyxa]MCJ1220326.1 formate dehydrogenase subunit alpha [Paenibacillus polymyxa]MDU8672213.1 formate dehydrogenase subunit alpha [Paenibacillus polymyxa]MDU8697122.1 formate dehydrogenase subunit alpha [Paenibacillus polymyxa]URJ56303.1 formate dehydrogenase subunit alpha [Paenibacillus polymyxa]